MDKTEINTTFLRRNMSDVLNYVYFKGGVVVVKRGDKVIAKIVGPDQDGGKIDNAAK